MYIDTLSLTDFRSYSEVVVGLDAGVNVFVGSNGQGKTNLVEALGYLAAHGSHRVATDAALVRSGADRAYLRCGVIAADRRTQLELEVNPGRANRVRINGAPVPRPRDALGVLRTVLFAPEDLAVVKGDPGERRRFLDDLLVARTPRMAAVRADYERVLRQRNALLKSAAGARRGGDLSTLDVWDGHLATTGAALVAARLDLVGFLRPLVDKAYAALAAGSAQADISYLASLGDGPLTGDPSTLVDRLLQRLADRRREELDRGISLVGPHRDELQVTIGALPARGYASHGESWSLALALRLASYELLRSDGAEPVLLLDDVFAELDADRRARLAEVAAGAEQVVVTAAVSADVPGELSGARFDVAGGGVRRVH